MADRRIRVCENKSALLQRLKASGGETGPFVDHTHTLAFAASLGASKGARDALGDVAKSPAPIRYSVFFGDGYDTLFHLLAVHAEGNPDVLAANDEMENRRATIFEEYANGGLRLLEEALRGLPSIDGLQLVLAKELAPESAGGGVSSVIDDIIDGS